MPVVVESKVRARISHEEDASCERECRDDMILDDEADSPHEDESASNRGCDDDERDAEEARRIRMERTRVIRSMTYRELGKRGEEAAVRYLEDVAGMEIVDRNWECDFGEADIIAFDEDELVFIEVKTRRGIEKGMPEEAVTPHKRSRYEKIAACYLFDHEYVDIQIRFDVIAILVVADGRALLRHHRSAFSHEG